MTGSPTDHDLLTIHTEQLSQACKMIGNTNKTLTDFILKIDDRCDLRKDLIRKTQENSMKTGTFWKILTVLVVILMSMFGVIGYNREVSMRNEVKIDHISKQTEKNGELLEELLKGLIKNKYNNGG